MLTVRIITKTLKLVVCAIQAFNHFLMPQLNPCTLTASLQALWQSTSFGQSCHNHVGCKSPTTFNAVKMCLIFYELANRVFNSVAELPYVMSLVRQSFEKQMGNGETGT